MAPRSSSAHAAAIATLIPDHITHIRQTVDRVLADQAPLQQAIALLVEDASSDTPPAIRMAAIDTIRQAVFAATLQAIDPAVDLRAGEPASLATPPEADESTAAVNDVFQDWLEQLTPIATVEAGTVGAAGHESTDRAMAGTADGGADSATLANMRQFLTQTLPQFTWSRSPSPAALAEQRQLQWEQQVRQIMQHLRHTREHHGISLKELHQRTNITLHQLQILESGQLDQYPEEIYLRGFIRRIGQALGLNGIELARSLPSLETKPASAQPVSPHATAIEGRSTGSAAAIHPLHLYLAYAAVMGTAATGLNLALQDQQAVSSDLPPLDTSEAALANPKANQPNTQTQLEPAPFQQIAPPDVLPDFNRSAQ